MNKLISLLLCQSLYFFTIYDQSLKGLTWRKPKNSYILIDHAIFVFFLVLGLLELCLFGSLTCEEMGGEEEERSARPMKS